MSQSIILRLWVPNIRFWNRNYEWAFEKLLTTEVVWKIFQKYTSEYIFPQGKDPSPFQILEKFYNAKKKKCY